MLEEYLDQPNIESWKFREELQVPLHEKKISLPRSAIRNGEVSLSCGVSCDFRFPDPEQLLETAVGDFHCFLAAAGIPENGPYRIMLRHGKTSCFEAWELEVTSACCILKAADTEGIRRGLAALEDLICRSGGQFLPLGRIRRQPFVKTRLSRCTFGPINRPPFNRDELMDEIDYYPGEYLNRLAHEGVNALWISAEFCALCPSKYFPGHGRDSERRLEKLRQTVSRCRRYGIKIYLLCNEPRAFGGKSYILPLESDDCLRNNPLFRGHASGTQTCFCTSSFEAQEYLRECTFHIFSQVPDLGGLINISFGERPTHCYCSFDSIVKNNCPRCSGREPGAVFREMLEAMQCGMRQAAPGAQLISWFYIPAMLDDRLGSIDAKAQSIRKIASMLPADITVQFNFESNGTARQLGRKFTIYDYHLAYIGPSGFFREWSAAALANGNSVSAKLQTGCSHEDATVPFIPVPGALYQKYRAAKQCGVSTAMQSWYFGNWPGVMNKAAGELSFLPFPRSEKAFLKILAQTGWGDDHPQVVKAWQYFQKGYSFFPMELSFSWFGPLHCSIVWPLHLYPVDQPIAPSWEFGFPESGDRIGECVGIAHTLDEVLLLLKQMERNWQKGTAILSRLKKRYQNNRDRYLDIGVAEAVGLQISSSLNIFKFYDWREKLPYLTTAQQRAALKKMGELVKQEIRNSRAMKHLCEQDPRLGFHPEAEGYKFFPLKLEKRVRKLQRLLRSDFPRLAREIGEKTPLFPGYTGQMPGGKIYRCRQDENAAAWENAGEMKWSAWHDDNRLCFKFIMKNAFSRVMAAGVNIEPRRLWPCMSFFSYSNGARSYYDTSLNKCGSWEVEVLKNSGETVIKAALPLDSFPGYIPFRPLRINVGYYTGDLNCIGSWVENHPLKPRLLFGSANSADLGWLILE